MSLPPDTRSAPSRWDRPLRFSHVAIVGKYHAPGARNAVDEIANFPHGEGCDVSLEKETAANTGLLQYPALDVPAMGKACDLALVVGGDGTMLGIGRQLARYGVPLVGINQGRLGFITDIPFDTYRETLRPMLRGDYQEDVRALMAASVWRDGRCVFQATALNDVVVNRGGIASMIELRVEVDGHFVANQRADGLIIASPTGSTAYALSAGGPILHPGIAGWVVVPIASHTLSNRPIVLPDHGEVRIGIVAGKDVSANFDMHNLASLLHGDEVHVRRSAFKVRFLHPRIPLYIVPRGPGLFMIGATMIESAERGRASVRSLLELLTAAYALHPAFGEAEVVEIGHDARPAFPDNTPALRQLPGRLCLNGLYRHGYLMAPWLARRAADLLTPDLPTTHLPTGETA